MPAAVASVHARGVNRRLDVDSGVRCVVPVLEERQHGELGIPTTTGKRQTETARRRRREREKARGKRRQREWVASEDRPHTVRAKQRGCGVQKIPIFVGCCLLVAMYTEDSVARLQTRPRHCAEIGTVASRCEHRVYERPSQQQATELFRVSFISREEILPFAEGVTQSRRRRTPRRRASGPR